MVVHSNIRADVIILGCSLPGIVAAHKLKKTFGKSMDIVVLDMSTVRKDISKGNVAFQVDDYESEDDDDTEEPESVKFVDNIGRDYLLSFSKEFGLPLPDAIANPKLVRSPLNKLFQYLDGSTVQCTTDYHNFDYLNVVERFELNQYQDLLDQNARDLFQPKRVNTETERRNLLYFDKTTMESHLCGALLFSNSRQVMRMMVQLVCGTSSYSVSVLFYLHQCYRTSSMRNHLDGANTRFREKLFGYCTRHFSHKLQKSVADITLVAKPIQKIRSYSNEQVILETIKGETNYICNLLAMAVRPDELLKIAVEEQFMSNREAAVVGAMLPGRVIKFRIQYERNFWQSQGYSGDILSMRGPIVWAMERPLLTTTGTGTNSSLVGVLIVKDGFSNTKDAVLEQLTNLFGEEAAKPLFYKEKNISDIFVPRCGDYVALRNLTSSIKPNSVVEWGALDVFGEGDVAAALEAGHKAYLHLLRCLRPQATTFEDFELTSSPTILDEGPLTRSIPQFNYMNTIKIVACTTALIIGIKLIRTYTQK
ncbi:probable flavin-containing monoamine oxidase B [Cydia fagiglandana]|uniref:probable flavin-containing monoamine oxidase B n=1 Tax=Cydia fagiglandana TaxID=1458189 RepID=UPI002FEE5BC6